MIAQQELQNLLNLPDQEKLLLAHWLLESLVARTNGQPGATEAQTGVAQKAEPAEAPSPSAQVWLSMAGMYSGGAPDTGERADEICAAEIKRYSGFTLKEELPER